MKLILISSSEKAIAAGETSDKAFGDTTNNEPAIVTQMFENGLETFHLRKTRFSLKEMKSYIEKIPAKFHNKIILHSYHFLALKYGTKGINLSKNDKKKGLQRWVKLKWIKLQNPNILITTSCSRTSSLFDEKYKYDYVLLSPVFDNLTGDFTSGKQQISLKSVIQKAPNKIIARGGVSVEKVEVIQELGFAGLSIQSSIWKKKDPLAEFIRFKEKFLELGIPIE